MPPRRTESDDRKAYWTWNLVYLRILLAVWFIVSYGCGIIFVEQLNAIRIGGFKLGFWFAQQGAIIGFVVLILIYAIGMAGLDRSHRRELEQIRAAARNDEQ